MAVTECLIFDKLLYNVEAIQKAAYKNMNSIVVDLSSTDTCYLCEVTATIELEKDRFSYAIQEFKKDVLDYQLRHQLNNETKVVKNLILGLVFSKTGLV